MPNKIHSVSQFEQFKAELSNIPFDETRFNLQRRMRGSAIDYVEAIKDPQSTGDQRLVSLLSHIAVSQAAVRLDTAKDETVHVFRDLAWVNSSRACISAISSEIGIPEEWISKNILFDDSNTKLLRGLSRLACAFTEPGGAYSDYELASGFASGQVAFDGEKYLKWRVENATPESQ